MAPVVVYITGFRQNAGKTVTALGIISQLAGLRLAHPMQHITLQLGRAAGGYYLVEIGRNDQS